MKKNKTYEAILDVARNNYGVFTTAQLRERGISPESVRQFAYKNNSIRRDAKGVYTLYEDPEDIIDYEFTEYAQAVAIGGKKSFLYGDTVLAMLDLATVIPRKDYVAVPWRTTSKNELIKKIRYIPKKDEVVQYNGLPAQHLKIAILKSIEAPTYKLRIAAVQCYKEKLLTYQEKEDVLNKLDNRYDYV
jgi:predicted transcriptional regulator of viral defense system